MITATAYYTDGTQQAFIGRSTGEAMDKAEASGPYRITCCGEVYRKFDGEWACIGQVKS